MRRRSSTTMSCSSAATSIPVGPPPTMMNDSSCDRSCAQTPRVYERSAVPHPQSLSAEKQGL